MDSINSLNSMYANNSSVTSSSTSALENKLDNTNLSTATDDELMEVCKDFEAYFTEQMLKSMVKMADVDGDDDDNNMYASLFGMTEDSDAGMSTMASYFGDEMVVKMAESMTEAQGTGLGLAQTLYEQMKRNYGIPSVDENAGSAEKLNTEVESSESTGL